MKVAVVLASAIRVAPYAAHYVAAIQAAGHEPVIICWERGHASHDERTPAPTTYEYCHEPRNTLDTIMGYWKYSRFLKRTFTQNDFCGAAFLTVQSALCGELAGWRGPYMVDVRDKSHEGFPLYRRRVREVLAQADLVTMSSPGYSSWLPYDVSRAIYLPNYYGTAVADAGPATGRRAIAICYVGLSAGDFSTYLPVVEAVSTRRDITLRFIGTGWPQSSLANYCRRHHKTNVEFYGTFTDRDKSEWINRSTAVLGRLGDKTMGLPNRLYDAASAVRCYLCSDDTYSGQYALQSGVGEVFDTKRPETILYAVNRCTARLGSDELSQRCKAFLVGEYEAVTRGRQRIATVVETWCSMRRMS